MPISHEALFKVALNLEDPWYITSMDFSVEGRQLDIHVDFKSGSKFPCAKCEKPSCSVHDTIGRTWRHLNFFQFKTYIHCRVPRTKCEDCGVKQVKVPWARKGSGFTLLMDSMIVLMAQHMTVTAIAEMIDEHDTRIWRVLGHYVAEARSHEDFSKVKSVGVDETSRAKGHKYVSVFIDLDKSRVIHVCEGKDASTIESFKTDLEQHNGSSKNIDNFCCDMSPAFISGIENSFPNASITFDKFHVTKLMNEAVDKVRREEQSQNALLKKTRFVWLKNPENLTIKQKETLRPLKDLRLKTLLGVHDLLSNSGRSCHTIPISNLNLRTCLYGHSLRISCICVIQQGHQEIFSIFIPIIILYVFSSRSNFLKFPSKFI